jgi:L-asparaginase
MTKPRIAVASLGGTITMMANPAEGSAVVPKLNVDDLLASAPAITQIASISAETLSTVPGASLEFSHVIHALEWSLKQVQAGASGVVLAQGTDTIEETAYLLDLYWNRPEPLIVTGSMRSPALPGADGPANLLAAVRAAASPESQELGVLVVMNDEIHAAPRVRKTRANGTNAFTSPNFGPVGFIEEGLVVYGNRSTRWLSLTAPFPQVAPRVALLETYLGDDASTLDLVASAGFDGIVIAGLGVGHVSPAMASGLSRALSICPVVLASRTGAGTAFRKTYGFLGSESDLLSRGAISAGWLDPRKARILLSCLLASGSDRYAIRTEFDLRGGNPGGPRTF